RADQSRTLRNGDGIVGGTFAGFLNHRQDIAELFPSGVFRNDSAGLDVNRFRRGDDVRNYFPAVLHDGGSSLVAASFDTEGPHKINSIRRENSLQGRTDLLG